MIQLHLALKIGYVDLVQFLIKHIADTAVPVKGRWTLLYVASHHGHGGLAWFLIKHSANITTADKTESTPHIGHGINLTAQNKDRWTCCIMH